MVRVITALIALIFWPLPAHADVEVRVDKASQRMFVSVDGQMRHFWTVSTGLGGGPHNGAYKPQRLERKWHSRKYNMAPMPYAIFFDGNYAIHGTTQVKQLGRRASKGCVRLHPENAAVLFALVQKHGAANTRIVIEPVAATGTAAGRSQRLAEQTDRWRLSASRAIVMARLAEPPAPNFTKLPPFDDIQPTTGVLTRAAKGRRILPFIQTN